MTEERATQLCEQFKRKIAEVFNLPVELLESDVESWSESCRFTVRLPHVPEYYGWNVRYWMWENRHVPHWNVGFVLFGVKGDHRTVSTYNYTGRGQIKVTKEMRWAAKECLKRMKKSG